MNIVNWDKNGLGEITDNNNIILSIDSSLISTHQVEMPNINIFQVKKAIPFTLEDELLDDIENLEFFIKKQDNKFSVWVIAKSILEQIKNTIKEQKLSIIGAYPSFMFLSQNEDNESSVSYSTDGDNVIFRDSKFSGGILPKDLFFTKFKDKNLSEVNDYSKDYNLINFIKLDIKEFINKNIKPWFGVIILFILSFILYFISTIIENNTLEDKLILLKIQNENTFKQTFPEVAKIVDIRVQTEQKLKSFNKQQKLSDKDLISAILNQRNLNNLSSIKFDKTIEIK